MKNEALDIIEIAGITYTFDRFDKALPQYVRKGKGYTTIVTYDTPKIYRNGELEISIIPGSDRKLRFSDK